MTTVTGHVFPSLHAALAAKQVDLSTDTLQVLLIASGSYSWNSTALAAVHVSDFLAGSGSGPLSEVSTSGTGYARQALTAVAVTTTYNPPAAYVTLTASSNPTWSAATFTCSYGCVFDNSVGGTDATNQLIGYWDFGAPQAVTPASAFVINLGSLNGVSQGVVQWQTS